MRLRPNTQRQRRILQTIWDRVKLLTKQDTFSAHTINNLLYASSFLFIILSLWISSCFSFNFLSSRFLLIWFLIIRVLEIIPMLLVGWVSKNTYSVLRTIRRVLLLISFEIVWIFFLVVIILSIRRWEWAQILEAINSPLFYIRLLIFLYLITLAEICRTPFDLTERESELVSGFNLEYRGSRFTFIFLREYAFILFSYLLLIFLYTQSAFREFSTILWRFLLLLNLITRSTLPRLKTSKVIKLFWMDLIMLVVVMLLFELV